MTKRSVKAKKKNFFTERKLKAYGPHPRDHSTHRQTPWTENDSSLLFVALGKAEPLISTATHQKFYLHL